MIIVTGAAGFIGSCVVQQLNEQGKTALILVDDFSDANKDANWKHKQYTQSIDRATFLEQLPTLENIEAVIHLGARTDTTETDVDLFNRLNLNYSKAIFNYCTQQQIPLVYASSAATYGLGEQGYDDRTSPTILQPLNAYGDSKNDFDKWVLQQEKQPPFWAGLKFFNVYGPNEYHKGRMASVVLHTFRQIQKTGKMRLFRSHRVDVANGQQSRDFIYIKDLLSIIDFMLAERPANGLYNVGTGQARSFWDLATQTFLAMGLTPDISFIDTPADIRDTYQYFTEANLEKLRQAGYNKDFYSLEDGVRDYVQSYLKENLYF